MPFHQELAGGMTRKPPELVHEIHDMRKEVLGLDGSLDNVPSQQKAGLPYPVDWSAYYH